MRYTTLLLRYQKDLVELESQNALPSPEILEKINILHTKIQNIEKIIQDLAQ